MMDMMNILIVNDDGIRSESLLRLQKTLEPFGAVFACVPDGERSGSSHSTHKYDITAENFLKSGKGERIYTHKGTASDSVKFFRKFVTKEIDLVISGVNGGFNLGCDIVYSGTVGAALEANMYGIRSIALSARQHGKNYWAVLPGLLERFIHNPDWNGAMCLNVNFPDQPDLSDAEIRFTPVAQTPKPEQGDNDYNLCRNQGFITITPLRLDLTDTGSLKQLKTYYEERS